jgi:hypothetical protein
VKADGGTVVLDAAPEGGLRVAITLPLANGGSSSSSSMCSTSSLRDERVPLRV